MRLLTLPRVTLLAAVAGLAPLGCGGPAADWPDKPGPKVVVTFPPLYCFAANVAGDDATVRSVMSTRGPHEYEPTPSDAKLLAKADLFFSNGLGLDDGIADKLQRGSGNKGIVHVPLGGKIDPKHLAKGDAGHDHPGHHHHGGADAADPHVWLGLDLAPAMVTAVRDELKAKDPPHADGYDRRAAEYLARLEKLKGEGTDLLAGVPKGNRKFVTTHESLTYFARTFGLEVAGVIMTSPGREPTAEQLKALVAECKEHNVRVIAVEPQYSSRGSADRLLTELKNAGVPNPVLVPIDPLETADGGSIAPDWYEAKMRENLRALAEALK